MRRIHRVLLLALIVGVAPAIAGCADFDLDNLDVLGLNQKKKLPGERHALFPEGVPGVSQGIPQEYMKGNAQEQPGAAVPAEPIKPTEAATESKTAAAEPVEEKPEAKPKPKHKPKRVAARPKPTRVKVEKPEDKTAAEPAPAQQQAAPWPAPQQAQPAAQTSPWPSPAQAAPAPWPSSPPPGTFSKQ